MKKKYYLKCKQIAGIFKEIEANSLTEAFHTLTATVEMLLKLNDDVEFYIESQQFLIEGEMDFEYIEF